MSFLSDVSDFKRGERSLYLLKRRNQQHDEYVSCSTGHRRTAYKITASLSRGECSFPTLQAPLPGPETPEWMDAAQMTIKQFFVNIILKRYSNCLNTKPALSFPSFQSDSVLSNIPSSLGDKK